MLCLLASILLAPAQAQMHLNFGKNTLPVKPVEYSKNKFDISPVITIDKDHPYVMKLVFKAIWRDRKERVIEPLENDELFIYIMDNNNNLMNYSNGATLVLKDDRKSKESKPALTTASVNVEPKNNFIVGQLDNGFIKTESGTLEIGLRDFITNPVTLSLYVFYGKIRKDELTILDNSHILEWEFYLPELDIDCDQLTQTFRDEIERSKPSKSMTWIQTTFDRYGYNEPTQNDWQELAKYVNEFRLSLEVQRTILERIQKNKDTAICKDLLSIKKEIRLSLNNDPVINEIFETIKPKLTQGQGGGGTALAGGTAVIDLKTSAESIERYYKTILEMDMYQKGAISETILKAYTDSADNTKSSHDELMAQLSNPEAADVVYYNDKFITYYNAFNELIGTASSGGSKMISSSSDSKKDDTQASKSGKKLPLWSWIIMGLVAILVAIGIWKFFPLIKKGMKVRGRFK